LDITIYLDAGYTLMSAAKGKERLQYPNRVLGMARARELLGAEGEGKHRTAVHPGPGERVG